MSTSSPSYPGVYIEEAPTPVNKEHELQTNMRYPIKYIHTSSTQTLSEEAEKKGI